MFRFHFCIVLLSTLFFTPRTAAAHEVDQFPYSSFPTRGKTVTLKSGKKAILVTETSNETSSLLGMRCLFTGESFDGFKTGATLITRLDNNDSPQCEDLIKKIKDQSIVIVVIEKLENQRIVPKSKRPLILLTTRGSTEKTKIAAELVYQYGMVKRRQDKLVPLISAVDQIANFDFGFGSLGNEDKKWVMQKVEDYTKILGKVGNAKESLSGIVELRTKLFIAELESKQPLDSLEKSLDNIEKKLLLQVDCEERIHKALGQWPRDEKRRNLARIEIQIAELGRDIVQSQRRFDSDMRDLEFQIALEEAEEQDWYAQQQAYEDSYNTQEASSDFDPRRVYYGNQFRDLRHNYSSNPDHRPVSGR